MKIADLGILKQLDSDTNESTIYYYQPHSVFMYVCKNECVWLFLLLLSDLGGGDLAAIRDSVASMINIRDSIPNLRNSFMQVCFEYYVRMHVRTYLYT